MFLLDYYEFMPMDLPEELNICSGEISILAVSDVFNTIRVNGIESDSESLLFDIEGIYEIAAIDINGCEVMHVLEVWEIEGPGIEISDMIDISYEQGIPLPVSYTGDIWQYEWMPLGDHLDCFDCAYPLLIEAYEGSLSVKATDEYGCSTVARMNISYASDELYLPNAVSNRPTSIENGIFSLKSNNELIYDMEIYDRWGNRQYNGKNLRSNSMVDGWQPAGQYIPGVYVYVIKIYSSAGVKVIKGDVTLF
jgi:hypothetical protein